MTCCRCGRDRLKLFWLSPKHKNAICDECLAQVRSTLAAFALSLQEFEPVRLILEEKS